MGELSRLIPGCGSIKVKVGTASYHCEQRYETYYNEISVGFKPDFVLADLGSNEFGNEENAIILNTSSGETDGGLTTNGFRMSFYTQASGGATVSYRFIAVKF